MSIVILRANMVDRPKVQRERARATRKSQIQQSRLVTIRSQD